MKASAFVLGMLAVTTTARAGERDRWDAIADATLDWSVDGDPVQAARRYHELLQQLGDSPESGDLRYRLARARWDLQLWDEARDALRDGIRTGSCAAPCFDLLGRIELDAAAIRTTPVTWTFDGTDHGIFHPWGHSDVGSIRTQTTTESADPALIWSTTATVREGDELVVAFDRPLPPPSRIAMSVRATQQDAWLRAWVIDADGNSYFVGTPIRVPTGSSIEWTLDLDEATAIEGSPTRLDASRLWRLILRDTTALDGSGTGPNDILIDDFRIF